MHRFNPSTAKQTTTKRKLAINIYYMIEERATNVCLSKRLPRDLWRLTIPGPDGNVLDSRTLLRGSAQGWVVPQVETT
jgi:hypothetical protein